jgi:hypothetical protein
MPTAVGAVGETKAGQRRDHDVEGVAQERQHLPHLQERAGPTMQQHQRCRLGGGAPVVHEVEPETVDLAAVVVEPVDVALPGPPVEVGAPVREQLMQVVKVGAVVPAGPDDGVGQAGGRQPPPASRER